MLLCTSDSRFESTLRFHKIPDDPSRKKEWIIKIRDQGGIFQGKVYKYMYINTHWLSVQKNVKVLDQLNTSFYFIHQWIFVKEGYFINQNSMS